MRFTKLQQEKIEQIIQAEMHSLNEGWAQAEKSKRSSLLFERNLFEAAPIEQDLSGDKVVSALENVTMDDAQSCMISFDNEVLKHIASILSSHGLLESGADAGNVYEMLADFDGDSMTLAQQECVADIKLALEKYASEISKLAAGMYVGM